eukprot:CAMPEP_0178907582 /NCGR_PEP_ID=MMETSP0786-20121207/7450_1 /TAXON_ID=186022 /ORGANISM="Thalassionema frauenfeldii, Strain CCMP 1798" /LENGTH=188 /DNA_ID=CAMNT_0020579395 /DNA_START=73 /DNA_END=636 /DNA_ORIENTATION=+
MVNSKSKPPIAKRQRRKLEGSNISLVTSQKNKQTGVKNAIQKCKKRRDVKFRKKAALLRQYQKTLKQEEITTNSSQIMRRRRRNELPEIKSLSENDIADTPGEGNGMNSSTPKSLRQRQAKVDPFKKSLRKVQQQKDMIAEKQKQQKKIEEEAVQREKRRHRQAKKLRQRTSKGQPVMKHVIGGLLDR